MKAVDLFAGLGGFTEGARLAGVRVLVAANHWRAAIDWHRRAHPDVAHLWGNLLELDMARLPPHDLLMASPACQGFSDASQPKRRPKHEADRNTAWAVVACAEAHRPRAILVENVERFRRWVLFPIWLDALRTLGYVPAVHLLRCSEFGVPQDRVRLIVSAGLGFEIPLTSPRSPAVAFRPAVDFGIEDGWRPASGGNVGRAAKALARGLREPFLIHQSTDNAGRSLDGPIGTITTKRQWTLVDRGGLTRMLSARELARGQGFADSTPLPESATLATRLIGNAIPPAFACEIVQQAVKVAS